MDTPNLHNQRYTFLSALRYGPVPFWQSLHAEVWRSRDSGRLQFWLDQWGIVDRWFIEDAIVPTLEEWELEVRFWLANRRNSGPPTTEEVERNPDLGNVCLNPQYRWFYYAQPGDAVHPFAPAGAAGLPRYSESLNAVDVALRGTDEQRQQLRETTTYEGGPFGEMLPRFFQRIPADLPEVRRRGAHHAEWVRHKRYLRALAEPNQNLVRHAEWTALLWSGAVTPMQIAREWRCPRLPRWGRPEKSVLMAVRRFADSIGLTMKK